MLNVRRIEIQSKAWFQTSKKSNKHILSISYMLPLFEVLEAIFTTTPWENSWQLNFQQISV